MHAYILLLCASVEKCCDVLLTIFSQKCEGKCNNVANIQHILHAGF